MEEKVEKERRLKSYLTISNLVSNGLIMFRFKRDTSQPVCNSLTMEINAIFLEQFTPAHPYTADFFVLFV